MKPNFLKRFLIGLMERWFISAQDYLSAHLPKDKFFLLENCRKRLGLDYSDLFWFCEDLRVHNQMKLLAEWKGFSGIEELFRKEEIEAITDAEKILKSAPVAVKEELRAFCHF
ncbi:MAG: hypothetical protein PHW54_06830 [Candidatus Omnitrophica bacterium]|jgi:hypothetical protein|nr:hypothetical protein [Candidatus Omnitrophota bacterium]